MARSLNSVFTDSEVAAMSYIVKNCGQCAVAFETKEVTILNSTKVKCIKFEDDCIGVGFSDDSYCDLLIFPPKGSTFDVKDYDGQMSIYIEYPNGDYFGAIFSESLDELGWDIINDYLK
jgi:hypothetical protein